MSTNCISGDSKTKIRALHEVLDRAAIQAEIPFRVYSIADMDSGEEKIGKTSMFQWPVYHIENFLLDPEIILRIGSSFTSFRFSTKDDVLQGLKGSAEKVLPFLVHSKIQNDLNFRLRRGMKIGAKPELDTLAAELSASVVQSAERVNMIAREELSQHMIEDLIDKASTGFRSDLSSGNWAATFPGRRVLKRFVDDAGIPFGYEPFRDLIVKEMVERQIRPTGMAHVVREILDAS